MKFHFNPAIGTILVVGDLLGPAGPVGLVLCLDTGATGTAINLDILLAAGYDPTQLAATIPLATGSSIVHAARLPVMAFEALGLTRTNYPIIAHTLPFATGVDGLLGLDFFQDHKLTIDFVQGEITLTPGKPAGPTP